MVGLYSRLICLKESNSGTKYYINIAVGIDIGVKRFLSISCGSIINSLEERLKALERTKLLYSKGESIIMIKVQTI